MPATFERYGCHWNEGTTDIQIEFYAIQHGGHWQDHGLQCGKGLFHHYRALQSLLWPEDDHHRWSDLILQTILDNTITAILGPKDAAKTHTAAKFALTDYFVFPTETLILMSSTDLRGLEMRVWGDLKNLWYRARQRYDWLPGNVLESMHAIVTDDLEESEIRDCRRGLVCFAAGTPVDTPTGPVAIEDIKPGASVWCAAGKAEVLSCTESVASRLVRVTLSDGRSVDCTEEHPFLTQRGWINALALETYDRVFSVYETMRYLRRPSRTRLSKSKALLASLPGSTASTRLRLVRKTVSSRKAKEESAFGLGKILQSGLRKPMGSRSRISSESSKSHLQAVRQANDERPSPSPVLFSGMSQPSTDINLCSVRTVVHFDPTDDRSGEDFFLQLLLQAEMDCKEDWSREQEDHEDGKNGSEATARIESSFQNPNRNEDHSKRPNRLRDRFGFEREEAGSRIGRRMARDSETTEARPVKNGMARRTWVDRVEILEPEGDPRFERSLRGYRVYNLHVAKHPSFSVNGVVVHNCIPCLSSTGTFTGLGRWVGVKQKRRRLVADEASFMKESFLDALANLNSGDFKGVFLGNPLGQLDPLDKIAEPEKGWESIGEPEKTTVWKNKFIGGVTINLVGTDSPNFDDPPNRYPYLINQKSIDSVVAFYGKESMQFYSQCKGVRRSGLNARRVITRELCDQFHAFEPVTWEKGNLTSIAALDAAYGGTGGDRCVMGHIQFGKEVVSDRIVIYVHAPCLVPVNAIKKELPEDQIAQFVKFYCESRNIPPENFFYDATGRGSLGPALARIWSAQIQPVEFGGRPTQRPVSLQTFIYDPADGKRRIKRCDEHYSKFVTELWFTVRYIVESDQMRGLPRDVAEEFYHREWKIVRGNLIEIEAKAEMKKRINRSPDLADWLVTACEGARRRGFQIDRLGSKATASANLDWLRKMQTEVQRSERKMELVEI